MDAWIAQNRTFRYPNSIGYVANGKALVEEGCGLKYGIKSKMEI